MHSSDLAVETSSQALAGFTLDVVVSGSIGAVEAVRFIRSLRRLGANVVPWLTRGGARFVTPMALAWAAGQATREDFSGDASHIAMHDACVVAPASASFLGKMALGLTEAPAAALVASYLGSRRPVLVLPNMHHSLLEAPTVLQHVRTLEKWVHFLPARTEEGKSKFPEPRSLADEVAHRLNRSSLNASALVTMGSTRGYIDDVRYLSNYSSGKLGSLIAEELYRLGVATTVVAGPCPVLPRVFGRLVPVATNEEMAQAAHAAVNAGAGAAVLAASVLDFIPATRQPGKISSTTAGFSVALVPTPKIIAGIHTAVKVGFKLEASLDEERARELALRYMPAYDLSLMVINALGDVDETRHKAFVFERSDIDGDEQTGAFSLIEGKAELASYVAKHVASGLMRR